MLFYTLLQCSITIIQILILKYCLLQDLFLFHVGKMVPFHAKFHENNIYFTYKSVQNMNLNVHFNNFPIRIWGPGWLSELVGLPNNSYKPITNTAWVCAWLCKLQKGCTRLAAASDKVYQLLTHFLQLNKSDKKEKSCCIFFYSSDKHYLYVLCWREQEKDGQHARTWKSC
jgi:hypothetical protein